MAKLNDISIPVAVVTCCRYQSQTCYKLVTSLSMESAQSITTMAAINDFHSRILNITLATTPDIRLLGKYSQPSRLTHSQQLS